MVSLVMELLVQMKMNALITHILVMPTPHVPIQMDPLLVLVMLVIPVMATHVNGQLLMVTLSQPMHGETFTTRHMVE